MSSIFIFHPTSYSTLLNWEVRLCDAEAPSQPFSVHSSTHQLQRRILEHAPVLCQGPLQSLLARRTSTRSSRSRRSHSCPSRTHVRPLPPTYRLCYPLRITTSTSTARHTLPNQLPLPPYLSIWRRFALSAHNPHILRQFKVIRVLFSGG